MEELLPSSVDVVVIGAGPAGLTLATLLQKYRPGTSIIVLERDHFPRHRIGESLLVDVNRVLADMGALDDVERAGFARKHGATFAWGRDRRTHSFLWRESKALVEDPSGYQLDYTWHVDRYEYDAILGRVARRSGVPVFEGHAVVGVLKEGERVTGVTVQTPDGRKVDVSARWVVDCAGRDGPLSRPFSGRVLDEDLKNIAVWGYHRGVGYRDHLNGAEDSRRTLILTHPRGWVWVIGLKNGITSVGYITSLASYRASRTTSNATYYADILKGLPERDALFANSELIDYRGDGRMIHSVQEYSYSAANLHGPGWVLCGDASGFVDAILSIGCFVAQNHAQALACTLASVLDGEAEEGLALQSYATSVRENLSAFRAVAHMFYAFNDDISDWWRECSRQLRQSALVPDTSDRQSFLAFFSGFSARNAMYQQAVNSLGGSFLRDVSEQLFSGEPLFANDAIGKEAGEARRVALSNPFLHTVPKLGQRPFVLPLTSAGRVRSVSRIEFDDPVGADQVGGGIGRHLYIPGELSAAVGLFDGTRSLSDVARTLHQGGGAGLEERDVRREVTKLAYRLLCMGAVNVASVAGAVGHGS